MLDDAVLYDTIMRRRLLKTLGLCWPVGGCYAALRRAENLGDLEVIRATAVDLAIAALGRAERASSAIDSTPADAGHRAPPRSV